MNINNNEKSFKMKFGTFIFIYMGVLAILFPPAHDDWAWGSSIGLQRLSDWFAGRDGRYLGNLLVIAITRSTVLRVALMMIIMSAIIILCYKIVNKNNKVLFVLSALLFFAMPRAMFASAYVWYSGFANYATSIVAILIYIYLLKDLFTEKETKFTKLSIIPLFLLAYSGGLLMEYITIYEICLGIFVIVYIYKRFKKVYPSTIAYLIGAILGAATMFSNSGYREIVNNEDSYRHVPSGISGVIKNAIDSYFTDIYKGGALDNVWINLIIGICAFIIIYKYIKAKRDNIGKGMIIFSNLIGLVLISFPIYSLITNLNPSWKILLKYTKYFEGAYSLIFYISIFLFLCIYITNKALKGKLIFLFLSVIILIGPLLVVNPLNPRCFSAVYIVFILIVNELVNYLIEISSNSIDIKNILTKIILFILLVDMGYLLNIYANIHMEYNRKMKYIYSQVENKATSIDIPEYRYENYLWRGTPVNDKTWRHRFRVYYGIPKNVKLKSISFSEWHEKYGNVNK